MCAGAWGEIYVKEEELQVKKKKSSESLISRLLAYFDHYSWKKLCLCVHSQIKFIL